MFIGLGAGLLVGGLFVTLDLLTINLGFVGDGALATLLLLGGLLIVVLAGRSVPPRDRRVMYVQSSRDDRVAR